MALVLKDRVKVSATTTGTGTFTLGAAVTGFQDFNVIGNGNTTYYTIVAQATPDFEVGIGTYTASGTLLSRDTILESSNGGAAVDFPVGTKDVFVTYPAERAVYEDAAGDYPVQNTFGTLNAANAVLTAGTISTTPSAATDIVNKTYVDTAVTSTVTSVAATAGTGISVSGSPITTSGTLTIINTAPDQTVSLTAGTGISTTGTYPNFTITNTAPSSGGTVTSVGGTGTVNGISLSGTVTTSGNLTLGGTLSGVSLTTQVSGTLPIANGGTNATTAATALSNLGAYPATNPNGYITSSGSISGNAATATSANNLTSYGIQANVDTFYNSGQFGFSDSTVGRPASYGQGIGIVSTGTAWNGSNNWYTQLAFDTGTSAFFRTRVNAGAWSSWFTFLHSGNFGSYALPLTGGNMTGLLATVGNTAAFTSANDTTLSVRSSGTGTAASMSFHRPGAFAVNLGLDTDNIFKLGGWSAGGVQNYWDFSGNAYATGSMRAPIFYDLNNTAYYCDPNSTSRLGTVNADLLRSFTDVYTDQNYGYGLIGLYSAVRYQGVFAMGNSYKLPANGTSTGNLYGIAWSHPNAGGAAANLASHGMLILENGTFAGAWGGGSLRTPSDVRGTIFYDYNNTGFYVDPASNSNINTLNGRNITNLMFYEGFTLNADTMSTNATGFTYSVNAPYTGPIMRFGSGAYDTQFNTTYGGVRLAYRNRNGDNGAWYPWQIVTTYDSNPGGDLYANRFYDAQNSGFYCDPNSTSNLNVLELSTNTGSGNWPQRIVHPDRGIYFINTFGSAIPCYFTVNTGGTLSGYILTSGGTTQYLTSSDYRMKENVQDLDKDAALAKIMAVKPVTFNWLETHGGKADLGFIAHELQEVVPECVAGAKDAMMPDGKIMPQGVDTSFLMPTLCAAIQKQQELIEQLMAKVAVLEGV